MMGKLEVIISRTSRKRRMFWTLQVVFEAEIIAKQGESLAARPYFYNNTNKVLLINKALQNTFF